MLRRLLPTLVVLGLGLAALLWGLGSLQRIFVDERNEAHAQVWAERNALQEYARRTLEQMLDAEFHRAQTEIDTARENPLMGTAGLLLVESGHQVFPGAISYAEGDATPARDLYNALRHGLPMDAIDGTSPWGDRVELIAKFRRAVAIGDPEAVETSFRDLLRHRSRYVLDSRLDIPARVAEIDTLVAGSDPNPELLSQILRDGFGDGEVTVIEGLQPALLRRRDRFGTADFQFLSGRIIDLSLKVQTRVDDFRDRATEPVTVPLPLPSSMDQPSLILNGTWYARPAKLERVIGVSVSVADKLTIIEEQMRARALLDPQDSLVRPPLGAGPVGLLNLPVDVSSPRFGQAIDASDQRFWVKTGFVALSAVLVLVIVALAAVVQSRKQRFLELKTDFVATVSHELRTPLASIRLMAETLERRVAGVRAARDYPTRIVREIDELSFLVDNILSFNRLDKGRWKPRRDRVVVREIIEELETELPQVTNRPVEITTRALGQPVLTADRELLKLLLRNLIKNACAYNERSPVEVEFRSSRVGFGTAIHVRDNGVGIPATQQKHVFSDFYRAGPSATRGSGLGLAICRKTMQAHGGRIRVADSGPSGTDFELLFPADMVEQT